MLILISDIEMPNPDGIGLTDKIRAVNLDHYGHVILVSGADATAIRDRALRSGVDDFITKGKATETPKTRITAATRLIHHAAELAECMPVLKERNDRIQADLQAAASAQRPLLSEMYDDIMEFRIAPAFVPSSIVSGEIFDCFPLGDE